MQLLSSKVSLIRFKGQGPRKESSLKEPKLLNIKCINIACTLLAQHYDLCCQFSKECKGTDQEMIKLEMKYHHLKVQFKEKENDGAKNRVTCKKNTQYCSDKPSCGSISLTKFKKNESKERCNYE